MRCRRELSIALAIAGLAACSTTDFTSTWKDPSARPGELQGKKVAAFLLTSNEALRRSGEDALAQELTKRGLVAMPGYQLAPGADQSEPLSKEALSAQLKQANFDGAVIMRVVDRRLESRYTPGSAPYGSMYGYWDYGWGTVHDPGYMQTDTIVSVETLVYSVPDDKLLWGGVSETISPQKVGSMIKEIVDKAAKEMKKQGLIVK
jgi:hypothetical protein